MTTQSLAARALARSVTPLPIRPIVTRSLPTTGRMPGCIRPSPSLALRLPATVPSADPGTNALVAVPRAAHVPPSASPNPRVPCMLTLDDSGSMEGDKIAQLNDGVKRFDRAIKADRLSAVDIEIGEVAFGNGVDVLSELVPVAEWKPRELRAAGGTPLGRALLTALSMIDRRLAVYRRHDLLNHPPMLVLITDGGETESLEVFAQAGAVIRELERREKIRFYPIGVDGADMDRLSALSIRPPYRLRSLDFDRFFDWLARSVRLVSRSVPGDGFEPDDPADAGVAERYEG